MMCCRMWPGLNSSLTLSIFDELNQFLRPDLLKPLRFGIGVYGYDGDWHYLGRPGFYGGRYNGGSFGPCWTRTPIGPVWNCG